MTPAKFRKIAITCRCGVRTVHELMEAEFEHGPPLVQCPRCDTEYVIAEGSIYRLGDNRTPEKKIGRKESVRTWEMPRSEAIN